jgi:GNAT superfamily N-acetyltransferase
MLPNRDIRVIHLLEKPEVASTLKQWFIDEWAPWYGPDGPGDAESDLAACRSHDTLPICLVALNLEGEVVGTASLRSESVGSEHGVGPWLAAVLVSKDHLRKGVGTALVKAIEEEATRLKFESIYTSTNSAMNIMERQGWEIFGTTDTLRGPATIYRKPVGGETEPA